MTVVLGRRGSRLPDAALRRTVRLSRKTYAVARVVGFRRLTAIFPEALFPTEARWKEEGGTVTVTDDGMKTAAGDNEIGTRATRNGQTGGS
jgi:hypothetical protein